MSNTYTPYAVAKKLNETFVEYNIDRVIPTQMMYNYTKNGLIDGVKHPKTTGVTFTEDVVNKFIAKYISKNYKIEIDLNTEEIDEIVETNEVEGQMDLIDSLVESYNS